MPPEHPSDETGSRETDAAAASKTAAAAATVRAAAAGDKAAVFRPAPAVAPAALVHEMHCRREGFEGLGPG